MLNGIDLATDAGGVIQAITAQRLDFVARYYRNPTSHWPPLSASEAQVLSSAGLRIVTVFEGASTHASYFSRHAGADDGTTAYNQAMTAGQTPGSAIYFAVDYDASQSDMTGPVHDYFGGVKAGFDAASGSAPAFRIGVYGSGAVCQALLQAGLVDLAWLAMSMGWTGSRTFQAWNIKQGAALPALPFDHDTDEAQDASGMWSIGAMSPALQAVA